MTYENFSTYAEPIWKEPEVQHRPYDGLWEVWCWLLHPEHPLPPARPWHTTSYSWQCVGVFETKRQAEKWLNRNRRFGG